MKPVVTDYASVIRTDRALWIDWSGWSPVIPVMEDGMNKTILAALTMLLTLMMVSGSFGYETDFDDLNRFDCSLPPWKFGRGVVNLLSMPHEVFTNMTNEAIKGAYVGAQDGALPGYIAGTTNGMIAGTAIGFYKGLKRMTTGALEMLTFWKPEYGPTMEPLYGTRNRSFAGADDYFSRDPWWYNGPDR